MGCFPNLDKRVFEVAKDRNCDFRDREGTRKLGMSCVCGACRNSLRKLGCMPVHAMAGEGRLKDLWVGCRV